MSDLEARALALVRRMGIKAEWSLDVREEVIAIAREAEVAERKWRVRHTSWWSIDGAVEGRTLLSWAEAVSIVREYGDCPDEHFEIVEDGGPLVPAAAECGHGKPSPRYCVRPAGHSGDHVGWCGGDSGKTGFWPNEAKP